MAIRNTLMGGYNWTVGEKPYKSEDVNDTFDELARIVDNGN